MRSHTSRAGNEKTAIDASKWWCLHFASGLSSAQLFKLTASKAYLSLSAPVTASHSLIKPIADPLGQGEAGTRKAAELMAHSAQFECGVCDERGPMNILGLKATQALANLMLLAMTVVVSVTLRFVWLGGALADRL